MRILFWPIFVRERTLCTVECSLIPSNITLIVPFLARDLKPSVPPDVLLMLNMTAVDWVIGRMEKVYSMVYVNNRLNMYSHTKPVPPKDAELTPSIREYDLQGFHFFLEEDARKKDV